MRLILALLAILGLLASPVTAAAARARCYSPAGDAMMRAATAQMPAIALSDMQKAGPCCEPGKDQAHKEHSRAECAQLCAAMCGVTAALPDKVAALIAPPDRGPPPQARVASLKPHEPSPLERPPRSIA